MVTAASLALTFSAVALTGIYSVTATGRQATALVDLLPASDGVVGIDTGRLVTSAMPALLTANQPMLADINKQISEMRTRTGIDLQNFQSVALGVNIKGITGSECNCNMVGIARGTVAAETIIASAKKAAKDKYTQETVGERVVYIFSPAEQLNQQIPNVSNSMIARFIHRSVAISMKEIAITSLDSNTVVFGSLERVRAAIGSGPRISPELTSLFAGHEADLMVFAAKTSEGMSKFLPLDNDDLGANIDSIRYISGSLDVGPSGTLVRISAKTLGAEQAQSLVDTLNNLKPLGKMLLGNSKRPDQRVYAKMAENAKITRKNTSVDLELTVPQNDINVLIGAK